MADKPTYPTTRYHRTEPARIIDSPEQEEEGWEDSPAAHGIETAPGKIPDPAIAANLAEETDPPAPAAGKRKPRG